MKYSQKCFCFFYSSRNCTTFEQFNLKPMRINSTFYAFKSAEVSSIAITISSITTTPLG